MKTKVVVVGEKIRANRMTMDELKWAKGRCFNFQQVDQKYSQPCITCGLDQSSKWPNKLCGKWF